MMRVKNHHMPATIRVEIALGMQVMIYESYIMFNTMNHDDDI